MLRHFLVLLVVGCGSSRIGIQYGEPATLAPQNKPFASCTPSTRVTVTSSDGRPVAGALVVVRQVEHTSCPSMVPTALLYTTVPVRTNDRGVVLTCDPATFLSAKTPSFRGQHRDPPSIIAIAGEQGATLTQLWPSELRLTLRPCAANPALPCAK